MRYYAIIIFCMLYGNQYCAMKNIDFAMKNNAHEPDLIKQLKKQKQNKEFWCKCACICHFVLCCDCCDCFWRVMRRLEEEIKKIDHDIDQAELESSMDCFPQAPTRSNMIYPISSKMI